jgi:hypothetical protein
MAETLFSATLAVARMIPGNIVVDGVATGDGNANKLTLVDSAAWFINQSTLPSDDYYKGGTIWFRDLTTAIDEHHAYIITGYTKSTGTYTYTPALSVKTVTNDVYSASNGHYPRFILRQAVNAALAEVGGEDLVNTATTTVADQMTYDLPSGVYNIQRVEVATSLTSPYGYMVLPANTWREMNDDIYFVDGYQPTSTSYILRLTYRVPFTELTTDYGSTHGTVDSTCLLPDLADMNWIKWAGVAYCLRWKLGVTGKDEDIRDFLAEALKEAEKMANRYRPKMQQMSRDWPHSAWDIGGINAEIDSTVDHVRFH